MYQACKGKRVAATLVQQQKARASKRESKAAIRRLGEVAHHLLSWLVRRRQGSGVGAGGGASGRRQQGGCDQSSGSSTCEQHGGPAGSLPSPALAARDACASFYASLTPYFPSLLLCSRLPPLAWRVAMFSLHSPPAFQRFQSARRGVSAAERHAGRPVKQTVREKVKR